MKKAFFAGCVSFLIMSCGGESESQKGKLINFELGPVNKGPVGTEATFTLIVPENTSKEDLEQFLFCFKDGNKLRDQILAKIPAKTPKSPRSQYAQMSIFILKNKLIAEKVTQYMQGDSNDPLYKQKSLEFEKGVVATYYYGARKDPKFDWEQAVVGRGGALIEFDEQDAKILYEKNVNN